MTKVSLLTRSGFTEANLLTRRRDCTGIVDTRVLWIIVKYMICRNPALFVKLYPVVLSNDFVQVYRQTFNLHFICKQH